MECRPERQVMLRNRERLSVLPAEERAALPAECKGVGVRILLPLASETPVAASAMELQPWQSHA